MHRARARVYLEEKKSATCVFYVQCIEEVVEKNEMSFERLRFNLQPEVSRVRL